VTDTVVFFLLLLLAAGFDLRTRRIPNRLTLAGLLAGLALGVLQGGWAGLGAALLGAAAGFAVFFFLFALGAMGAGDVKLMAAVGALLGLPLVLWAALCSAVAGGVLGLLVVFQHRAGRSVLRSMGGLLGYWFSSRGIRKAEWLTLRQPGTLKVPYGVAIAAGCTFAALFPQLSVF
jgi:prepilin peptidase CpaA